MQILNSQKIRNDKWYTEWRLVGAYVFYAICLFDFIGAPIGCMLMTIYMKTAVTWTPLTTTGGGLFYFAFGSVLGISAYGKLTENKEMLKFVSSNDQPLADDNNKEQK